jgi:hypothetical protein
MSLLLATSPLLRFLAVARPAAASSNDRGKVVSGNHASVLFLMFYLSHTHHCAIVNGQFEISQPEITHDDNTSTNPKTAGTPPSSSEHRCQLLLAGTALSSHVDRSVACYVARTIRMWFQSTRAPSVRSLASAHASFFDSDSRLSSLDQPQPVINRVE